MIIYGVDWFMFDSRWQNRRYSHDSGYLSFFDFTKEITLNINNENIVNETIYNIFNITKHKKNLKQIFNPSHEHTRNEKPAQKGYAPLSSKYNKMPQRIVTTSSPNAFNCFNDLIDIFTRNNIEVVFINVPELITNRSSHEYDTGISIIERIATERGITFLNYNKSHISSINYNINLFSDWGHLNDKGGAAFTELLKKDLHTLYPDLF